MDENPYQSPETNPAPREGREIDWNATLRNVAGLAFVALLAISILIGLISLFLHQGEPDSNINRDGYSFSRRPYFTHT
jgi:hypothetical protein